MKRLGSRFWGKTASGTEVRPGLGPCLLWTGAVNRDGYGRYNGGQAHRAALADHLGRALGPGLHACHHCDNPRCVRGDHLFEATNAENMADMVAKGRQRRPSGMASGRRKVSAEDVRAIREDRRPQYTIAAAYGLNQSQVSRIQSGRSWATLSEGTTDA